jgi:hypothetical protein
MLVAGAYCNIAAAAAAGSGTDTRAWRLSWPPGFRVFEVDSPAVLAFKARVLSGAAAAAAAAAADGEQQQQQQQQQQPKLQCEQRLEVPADASQPEGKVNRHMIQYVWLFINKFC